MKFETNRYTNEYMQSIINAYGYFLDINAICKITGTNRGVIDNMIRSGQLPCLEIGQRKKVPTNLFVEWTLGECMKNQSQTQRDLLSKSYLNS